MTTAKEKKSLNASFYTTKYLFLFKKWRKKNIQKTAQGFLNENFTTLNGKIQKLVKSFRCTINSHS